MKKLLSVILCLALLAGCLTVCAAEEEVSGFGDYSSLSYRNDAAGIQFTLPEGWSFMSKAELAAAAGIADETLGNDAFSEAMEKGMQMNIMTASAPDGGSININATPIPAGAQSGLAALGGEKGLLESAAPDMIQGYSDMGFTITSAEVTTIDLQGATKDCFRAAMNIVGLEVDLIQFFQIGEECLYVVTIATMGDPAPVLAGLTITA